MYTQRKIIGHTPPNFVSDDAWFFITLCCRQRGINQLCVPHVSSRLQEDGIFYHMQQRWALHLLLLMPDHLHMIAGFAREHTMSETIRNWKRLTARRTGVSWQKNYFDHRIRQGDELQLKTDYIRQNPVRANLTKNPEEWPHFVDYRNIQKGR